MNTNPDNYFTEGCMRCPKGGTAECKVHNWTEELKLLRMIVLNCGLKEESKWGVPCYTYQDKNIVTVSAFKDYAALSFFKGSLLKDEYGIFESHGPNSQAVRIIKFSDTEKIIANEAIIKAYIFEAIEVEKAGLKVNFKKNPEPMPEELIQKLDEFPPLKSAFEALTPGRQRGYILYFSQPKQSKTRIARIEKYVRQILSGKGLNDR